MGRRLAPLTRELPKCLAVAWNGTTLFEEQLNTLRSCGISDFVVVRGYRGDAFQHTGIRYYWNREYDSTNVLESVMSARSEIEGECLILYSDIWFEPQVVETLMTGDASISVVIDRGWEQGYAGRTEHPIAEAETVTVDARGNIRQIGKLGAAAGVLGEFIGITRLSREGAQLFKARYDQAKARCQEGPFQRATGIKQAYLSDMLQELVDAGAEVTPVTIHGGWQEVDTPQDFQSLLRVWETMSEIAQ